MSSSQLGLAVSTLLASSVEFVEASTIVLAMGVTRGWRSALTGTIAALLALSLVTIVAGYSLIQWFPESILQLLVGTLLLIFGLQWLRNAILRSAGLKALHDENETFHKETDAARNAVAENRFGVDWFGFAISFKGVLLEGLEVVFIVITFGLNAGDMSLAIAAAALGGSIVLVAAIGLHRPLSRVPENTIKFAIGLLLSTFGTFWAVEGLGIFATNPASLTWPGSDLALIYILAAWGAVSLVAVTTLRPVADRQIGEAAT
jgi:Ca2+/H+ antiporter, TMEM165/GDT1 family